MPTEALAHFKQMLARHSDNQIEESRSDHDRARRFIGDIRVKRWLLHGTNSLARFLPTERVGQLLQRRIDSHCAPRGA